MQGGRKEEEMDVARGGERERERARESKRKPFWKEAKREMEDCGRRKKDGEGDGEM